MFAFLFELNDWMKSKQFNLQNDEKQTERTTQAISGGPKNTNRSMTVMASVSVKKNVNVITVTAKFPINRILSKIPPRLPKITDDQPKLFKEN